MSTREAIIKLLGVTDELKIKPPDVLFCRDNVVLWPIGMTDTISAMAYCLLPKDKSGKNNFKNYHAFVVPNTQEFKNLIWLYRNYSVQSGYLAKRSGRNSRAPVYTQETRRSGEAYIHVITSVEIHIYLILRGKYDEKIPDHAIFSQIYYGCLEEFCNFLSRYLPLRNCDLKRGDIIEHEHNYRNNGILIFNGNKLMPFNDDNSFNSTYLPSEFLSITEFPIKYWSTHNWENQWIDPYQLDVIEIKTNIIPYNEGILIAINYNNKSIFVAEEDDLSDLYPPNKPSPGPEFDETCLDKMMHVIKVRNRFEESGQTLIVVSTRAKHDEVSIYDLFLEIKDIQYNNINHAFLGKANIDKLYRKRHTLENHLNRSKHIKEFDVLPKVLLEMICEYDV